MMRAMRRRAIAYALLSAALFGASTPLAKLLVGAIHPLALAGVLYLGSGIGLAVWSALRALGRTERAPVARADWPWLAAALAAGGGLRAALPLDWPSPRRAANGSPLAHPLAVPHAAPR